MHPKAAIAVALVASLGVAGLLLKIILNIVSLAVWLTVAAIKMVVFLVIAVLVFYVVYRRLRHRANPR